MDQTPAHEQHNPDLLKIIPASARRLVEVGCSTGAHAREFKKLSPNCDYLGIETDPTSAALAKRHCDQSLIVGIEEAGDDFWARCADRDCRIFGDVIEHLKNPWDVLRKVRSVIPPAGVIVACIPNAQHWSVQVRLSTEDFKYEAQGLLDKTHLRWFTKKTIFELINQSGFEISGGYSTNLNAKHFCPPSNTWPSLPEPIQKPRSPMRCRSSTLFRPFQNRKANLGPGSQNPCSAHWYARCKVSTGGYRL